jgi:EAL domain-containing protein (putative c-di-GMP-specific phosphodiesterase class I)
MNTAAMQRMHMEQRLRRALERKEFTLHFQPIVELASNRIVGAEALLRWHDTENDCLVRPDEFIPAAEASGLIIPLGEWVLEEACTIARDWQERGLPPIKVAVNVSTMQLERSALTQITRDILLATGLEAARLELELTETVVMSLSAEVKEDLKSLQALGVSIALDDFGMGYSSLNYLRHLPIDKLKIDRSFVHGCVEQADQRSIIVAIIALAHALGYSVVGEGIETTQELGLLRQQGCDLGQGFLFSRPLTADRFADLVQSWDADSARPRLAHY